MRKIVLSEETEDKDDARDLSGDDIWNSSTVLFEFSAAFSSVWARDNESANINFH